MRLTKIFLFLFLFVTNINSKVLFLEDVYDQKIKVGGSDSNYLLEGEIALRLILFETFIECSYREYDNYKFLLETNSSIYYLKFEHREFGYEYSKVNIGLKNSFFDCLYVYLSVGINDGVIAEFEEKFKKDILPYTALIIDNKVFVSDRFDFISKVEIEVRLNDRCDTLLRYEHEDYNNTVNDEMFFIISYKLF